MSFAHMSEVFFAPGMSVQVYIDVTWCSFLSYSCQCFEYGLQGLVIGSCNVYIQRVVIELCFMAVLPKV